MKKFITVSAAAAMILSMGCSSMNAKNVPSQVKESFDKLYPNAGRVEWDYESSGYLVAEFRADGVECDAWFDKNGEWYLTESDIRYAALPEKVKEAFKAGTYGAWRVDDVDKVERKGFAPVYVIDVEQGENEADLTYSEDGILLSEKLDSESTIHRPEMVNEKIRTHIAQKYPSVLIYEVETENGMTQVDILDGITAKEVTYDTDLNWVKTEWEVLSLSLPDAARQSVKQMYPSARIDDVDMVQSAAQGDYYLVEVDMEPTDAMVKVRANGEIVK